MIKTKLFIGLLIIGLIVLVYNQSQSSCRPVTSPGDVTQIINQLPDHLSEVSGMAVSNRTSSLLWMHNDSGSGPQVSGLSSDYPDQLMTLTLQGILPIDWEAMGTYIHQGIPYIYIADIGDNWGIRPTKTIYRFKEPDSNWSADYQIKPSDIESIRFQYPDGRHDAETMLIAPNTGNIIIINKVQDRATVYQLASDLFDKPGRHSAEKLGHVYYDEPLLVDGDWGTDRIALRSYTKIMTWSTTTIHAMLSQPPDRVRSYTVEPQGEALAITDTGFYTTSEVCGPTNPPVYYTPW